MKKNSFNTMLSLAAVAVLGVFGAQAHAQSVDSLSQQINKNTTAIWQLSMENEALNSAFNVQQQDISRVVEQNKEHGRLIKQNQSDIAGAKKQFETEVGNIKIANRLLIESQNGLSKKLQANEQNIEKNKNDIAGAKKQFETEVGNIKIANRLLIESQNGLSKKLQTNEQNIKQNTNDIKQVQNKLDSIGLGEAVDKQKVAQIGINKNNIEKAQQDIEKNKQKIAENEKNIQRNEGNIAKHETNINSINKTVSELEKQVNTDSGLLKNVQDLGLTTKARVDVHQREIDLLKNNIPNAGNLKQIEANKADIAKAQAGIAENQKSINKNREAIAANNKGINDNKEAIAENQKGINKNSEAIAANNKGIAENKTAIAANTAAINLLNQGGALNGKRVENIEAQTAQNTAKIRQLDRKVGELDKELRRGFASQAALGGLFQPYNVGKLNVSAAVGGYRSETAVAVGTGYRFNEHFATKAGVSFNTKGGNAAYNVGVNFEW